VLAEFAHAADRSTDGSRWSYYRDLGRTRVVVIDSRAGRVLEEGRRSMLDEDEWKWVEQHCEGDFDHLLIATTVPWLLSPGLDRLEAWNEKACEGTQGKLVARQAEKLRRAVDFDHWGCFSHSFRALRDLLGDVAAGRRGSKPASVVVLAGDVHHAYLCEVGWPAGEAEGKAPVYQAVCSPYRNPLDKRERRAIRLLFGKGTRRVTRALARAAGVPDPEIGWRFLEGPHFDNQVASLALDGRSARIKLEKTQAGDTEEHTLETSFERRLA